jgi:predicted transcriptional regulator
MLANGTKPNLSEHSQRLIRCLVAEPGITVSELAARLPGRDLKKLRQLVTELYRQDTLELVYR